MRKILAAIAGLIAIPAAAFAADKGGPAPVVAQGAGETLALPFSGLYIGGSLGHATGTLNDTEGFKLPREGYTISALAGYNHRLPAGIILGVEGDLGLTDVKGSTNAGGFTISGSSRWIGSLRGRAGKAFGHTLLYGTAGVAMTNAKLNAEDVGSDSRDRLNGYVVGAGIEAAVFDNASIRLEYLHFRWADQAYTVGGADTGKLGSHDNAVRAALVFRLNQ
jgi:outer membrane immunogenic protein